ncbi:hypothetical protein [Rhodococcus sp. NPDC058521]|uniref:hypothetical protein n=1 Tax=Rhodococcus sp. NPDC058521 TaxID=3346536 RepID=UPI003666CB6C
MVNKLETRSVSVSSKKNGTTLLAYGLGALATAVGLGYALVDQIALGGLDEHLHAMYDPVGKSGEPGPLYGYLYFVGILALVCWWANSKVVAKGAKSARLWGWVTFGTAALAVLPPLVMREYGETVIPMGLSVGYVLAWVCGLVGVLALRRSS